MPAKPEKQRIAEEEHKKQQEEYRKQALEQVKGMTVQQVIDQVTKTDPYAWTLLHRRLRGKPLSYDVLEDLMNLHCARAEISQGLLLRHRPFLIQPLTDRHPHKVYKKARQVGVSELSLTEVLYFLATNPQTKWVYCVPTDAEIFTQRGWLAWNHVTSSDYTLAVDDKLSAAYWESIKEVKVFFFKGYLNAVGPFHCTPEHRWPVYHDGQAKVVRAEEYLKLGSATHLATIAPKDVPLASRFSKGTIALIECANAELRKYEGVVWCPQTPSGTWLMRYRGRIVFTGNTFPRDSQLKDFSVTRITEALEETPRMKALIGTPNQVYTKLIGSSYLILRSAWESNLGEGIDADGVTLDEKDRMTDGVDVAFRESLESSKYGWLREISTPTLPGRGIDELYTRSCQYEWFVKCKKCGEKQTIRWPDNVVAKKDVLPGTRQLEPNTFAYVCKKEKCRGELDRWRGEWVAKCPTQTHIAGYHMPQTIAPWIDATRLMQKKIDYKFFQLFTNYCLAECSTGDKILLSEEHFYRCIAGHQWAVCRTQQWVRIIAGIDWGRFNWVLILGVNAFNNLPYLIGCHIVEDDDKDPLGSARDVANYVAQFEPDLVIADSGYGKDRNAFLLKKFEGRFYAAYYSTSDKTSRQFRPQFMANTSRVMCDRTIALKTACQVIREMQIGLPQLDQYTQLLMKHMKALCPIQVEEDGNVYETIEATGDDHLAHCLAYALIGYDYLTEGWGGFDVTW